MADIVVAEAQRGDHGAPQFVTMDGILEGRTGDAAALSRAAAALDGLGIGHFQLERDGGRFSIMPENDRRPGARFDQGRQEKLLQILRDVAAAARGNVESTLRCTMVFDDECAETLFRAAAPPPEGPGIEAVTRMRPARPEDRPPVLPARPAMRQLLGRREVTIVLPLLVIAFGLLAWRSGLVDRVLAASAQGLGLETAAFGDLLAIRVEGNFGNYRVKVLRGPGHPTTVAEWDARTARAATESERLHDVVVREGQDVWVQLRDSAGEVLAQAKVGLRPLVTAADGEATVELPGHITASRVVLSVERHVKR